VTLTPRMRWIGALSCLWAGAVLLALDMIVGHSQAIELVSLGLVTGGAIGVGVEVRS